MGESIGVTLHVLVPAKWKGEDGSWPAVIGNLADHLCSWSGPEEDAGRHGFVCITMVGDANYGLSGCDIDGYLDPLTKLRIPWEGQGDAKYEYEAEWMLYDGNPDGKVLSGLPSGQDGPLVMTAGTYHAINLGQHEWAKTHWEFFHCQPGLPDTAPWLLDAPHPDDEGPMNECLTCVRGEVEYTDPDGLCSVKTCEACGGTGVVGEPTVSLESPAEHAAQPSPTSPKGKVAP